MEDPGFPITEAVLETAKSYADSAIKSAKKTKLYASAKSAVESGVNSAKSAVESGVKSAQDVVGGTVEMMRGGPISGGSNCEPCLEDCGHCKNCADCLNNMMEPLETPTGMQSCYRCRKCEKCMGCGMCLLGKCETKKNKKCAHCGKCLTCMLEARGLLDPSKGVHYIASRKISATFNYANFQVKSPKHPYHSKPGCEDCDRCDTCINALGCFKESSDIPRRLKNHKQEL